MFFFTLFLIVKFLSFSHNLGPCYLMPELFKQPSYLVFSTSISSNQLYLKHNQFYIPNTIFILCYYPRQCFSTICSLVNHPSSLLLMGQNYVLVVDIKSKKVYDFLQEIYKLVVLCSSRIKSKLFHLYLTKPSLLSFSANILTCIAICTPEIQFHSLPSDSS